MSKGWVFISKVARGKQDVNVSVFRSNIILHGNSKIECTDKCYSNIGYNALRKCPDGKIANWVLWKIQSLPFLDWYIQSWAEYPIRVNSIVTLRLAEVAKFIILQTSCWVWWQSYLDTGGFIQYVRIFIFFYFFFKHQLQLKIIFFSCICRFSKMQVSADLWKSGVDWLYIFYKPRPPWAVISGLNNLCFSYPFWTDINSIILPDQYSRVIIIFVLKKSKNFRKYHQ